MPNSSFHDRYLVVRFAGREYAIDASRLHGLLQARGLHLLPLGGHEPRRFCAQLHGRNLPVLAPHQFLKLPEQPVTARSCLLLIGEGHEGDPLQGDPTAAQFAILADSVSRLEQVPAHNCRDDAPHEYAQAQVRLGEKWRDVLDLDRLARACADPTPDASD